MASLMLWMVNEGGWWAGRRMFSFMFLFYNLHRPWETYVVNNMADDQSQSCLYLKVFYRIVIEILPCILCLTENRLTFTHIFTLLCIQPWCPLLKIWVMNYRSKVSFKLLVISRVCETSNLPMWHNPSMPKLLQGCGDSKWFCKSAGVPQV